MRRFAFAILVALAALLAPPVASVAGAANYQPVWVGDQSETRVSACPAELIVELGGGCTLTVVTTVPGHYELPDPNTGLITQVFACTGNYYIWPSMTAYISNGIYTAWTITLSAENWYNNCSAGSVWVNLSCQAGVGYSCASASHGGFWDSGNGYYQDWGNQEGTTSLASYWFYLRIHVYSSGAWTRWCYTSYNQSC